MRRLAPEIQASQPLRVGDVNADVGVHESDLSTWPRVESDGAHRRRVHGLQCHTESFPDDHRQRGCGKVTKRFKHADALEQHAIVFDLFTHHESWDVHERNHWYVERIAQAHQANRLVAGVGV